MVAENTTLLNPLMEGLPKERLAEPFAMVVLGAHGDLTKRKLIPAIYALFCDGLLPQDFCIVGMSRTQISDEEFRNSMKDSLIKFAPELTFTDANWDRFASKIYYLPGNFQQENGFANLAKTLDDLAQKHGTEGRNIFYMSTPPSLYQDIILRISEVGLNKSKKWRKSYWPRVVVEKPFGSDLKSATALDSQLHKFFDEKQVYRIDHYLGKETVQNIMVLRFANAIFEPIWNRDNIEQIQITNAETLGVEGRGGYYEEAGALRDMVQNHMLALLSLVAMEPPISLDADEVRTEKSKVLKCLRPIDIAHLSDYVVRGQYGPGYVMGEKVVGYRQEPSVSPESNTETFVALKLFVDNWRWAGVPFYIRSGKRLMKSATEIAIHFKQVPHRLFTMMAGDVSRGIMNQIGANVLVLRIQPDEGISLKFATKQPGATTQLRFLSMDFSYGTSFGVRSPSAYERLILDCVAGDGSLFARTDAVEASWELLTPVLEAWKGPNAPPCFTYPAGSWGPEESDELLSSDHRTWRRI